LLCAKRPFEQVRQGASSRAQMLDWFKQAGREPGGFYRYYKTLVEELSRLADGWARNAIGEVRHTQAPSGGSPRLPRCIHLAHRRWRDRRRASNVTEFPEPEIFA
jgi:hypothetical protein